MQQGDDEYLDAVKEAKKALGTGVCHEKSGSIEGSHCATQKKIMDDKLGFKLFRLGTSVGDGQAAANIANNDECVAETVMSNFWQGHFKDSALAYGAFGVFASVLAFILF